MSKIIILLIVVFFIVGCGGSSTASDTTSPSTETEVVETVLDDTNISGYVEPYYSQQWALDINSNFYSRNGIDTDAHIHPNGLYSTYTGKWNQNSHN